jgi:hypothetical protein
MTGIVPIVEGRLVIAASGVEFAMTLLIGRIDSGNFLRDKAIRAFLLMNDGERLRFDATCAPGPGPWHVEGMARAGSVDIPMVVEITALAPDLSRVHLGGTVTFTDVTIPLPGFSGVREIALRIDSDLTMRPAP